MSPANWLPSTPSAPAGGAPRLTTDAEPRPAASLWKTSLDAVIGLGSGLVEGVLPAQSPEFSTEITRADGLASGVSL